MGLKNFFYSLAAFCLLLVAVTCVAQGLAESLPAPEPVPEHLSVNQQELLVMRRNELEAWRLDLEARIGAHNQSCGDVNPDDWALLGECAESKARLEEEKQKYADSLMHYGDMVKDARKAAGEFITVRKMSEEDIRYFIIGHKDDGLDNIRFSMVDLEFPRPIRPWPGPKNPEKTVLDYSDPALIKSDQELLEPLNHLKLFQMGLDEVAQVIVGREEARERQARRKASSEMTKKREELEREYGLKPGESIFKKESEIPGLRRRLDKIAAAIAEQEIKDIYAVRQTAVDEFTGINEQRAKERDPKRARRALGEANRIVGQYKKRIKASEADTAKNFAAEFNKLRTFFGKDGTDPRCHAAINAMGMILEQRRREDDAAFQWATEELREVYTEFER